MQPAGCPDFTSSAQVRIFPGERAVVLLGLNAQTMVRCYRLFWVLAVERCPSVEEM